MHRFHKTETRSGQFTRTMVVLGIALIATAVTGTRAYCWSLECTPTYIQWTTNSPGCYPTMSPASPATVNKGSSVIITASAWDKDCVNAGQVDDSATGESANTYYQLDGGALVQFVDSAAIVMNTVGTHQIVVWAEDPSDSNSTPIQYPLATANPPYFSVTVNDTPVFDQGISGLGAGQLNNSSGASRSNFRWADTSASIGYGATFTPASNLTVYQVKAWVVPDIPAYIPYFLGDYFQTVALYAGTGTPITPTSICSGNFRAGSSQTNNQNISVAATHYADGENYQDADGQYSQIWEIDFNNLTYQLTSNASYVFGVAGTSKADRLWFNHAQSYQGGVLWQVGNGATTSVDPSGWLGGKQSYINIQIFAH